MTFSHMDSVAATLYFLGVYFHYVHLQTIFDLLDRTEDLDKGRAKLRSLFWPWTVVCILWYDLFGNDEDEE
jgi:uncharacterized membrane protein (DUF485 family)